MQLTTQTWYSKDSKDEKLKDNVPKTVVGTYTIWPIKNKWSNKWKALLVNESKMNKKAKILQTKSARLFSLKYNLRNTLSRKSSVQIENS